MPGGGVSAARFRECPWVRLFKGGNAALPFRTVRNFPARSVRRNGRGIKIRRPEERRRRREGEESSRRTGAYLFSFKIVREGVFFRGGGHGVRFNVLGTLDQRDAYGLAAVAHGVISVKEAAHEFLGAGIEHLLFSQVGVAVVAVTHEKEFVFLPVKDQAGAQLSKRPSFVQGYGNEDIADVVSGFFIPFPSPVFQSSCGNRLHV